MSFLPAVAMAGKDCARTSTSLVPLTQLRASTYQGFPGGLYPEGENKRPAFHEAAGLALAQSIQPLNEAGRPDADEGKIVLLASGMSNTGMEFAAFKKLVQRRRGVNPSLILINGAMGGAHSRIWRDPQSRVWKHLRNKLAKADLIPLQVQAIWMKHAWHEPEEPFPLDAQALKEDLVQIVRLLKENFPNLKLVYLSSRTYGGYAKFTLNPEPYAYQSGFAVKWVIEEQLKGNPELNFDPAEGTVEAPWLSWGPYLWADGEKTREDGLSWSCDDFGGDGTHPSDRGKKKVAELLWRFFTTDTTTKGWFTSKEGP